MKTDDEFDGWNEVIIGKIFKYAKNVSVFNFCFVCFALFVWMNIYTLRSGLDFSLFRS